MQTHTTQATFGVDALALAAVKAGRQVSEMIRKQRPPLDTFNDTSLQASLRRFGCGDVLNPRDDWLLEELDERLRAALNAEVLGTEYRLEEGTSDVDVLEYWILEEVIFTERGHELSELLRALDEFRQLRLAILDHGRAKAALVKLTRR